MATVTSMNLSELDGREYGPVSWLITDDSVDDFITLTGDDPTRWAESAPPGFAASALFAVAPDLLAELYEHSVVHGEQSFEWMGPLRRASALEVAGRVSRLRERGDVYFVTFEMTATVAGRPVLNGKSLFLASAESSPAGRAPAARAEPPHSDTGDPRVGQVSASRSDLVRYASATRDWNPVHWDHEAGIAAGFPGVVVHGLLQAAWALRAGSVGTESTTPFSSARFRFRNPLLPARPVDVSVSERGSAVEVVLGEGDTEYLTSAIELADE
ncbi:MAG: MaoC/PaaZ C-terminal domain-containing protein [Acidimicrobiia bacterium]